MDINFVGKISRKAFVYKLNYLANIVIFLYFLLPEKICRQNNWVILATHT